METPILRMKFAIGVQLFQLVRYVLPSAFFLIGVRHQFVHSRYDIQRRARWIVVQRVNKFRVAVPGLNIGRDARQIF